MFDILNKYKDQGHFFLTPENNLQSVSNAPTDKGGVFIIYALKKGRVEMIYIGHSGKLEKDGSFSNKMEGLNDEIVNANQFGKTPAHIAWKKQMIRENIEALNIYWYVTYDAEHKDCPDVLKKNLLRQHQDIFGTFPKWNKSV
ncbi:hypothetical protein [Chitinophaga sancti]|uniref:GIY-YIG domain-containing protein n=1 Tax=Chitinophaga sancti TaxID=1004 RepID=A0A1K1SM70_9BACT|nr:hypothetical protein [Chitinophaga sancti]WQD63915.1 hypothetical protein U0033_05865 [Chitinophaga sancti]WQG90460.1 hypothetical protein SR876_03055 [Chitinophaga sancti]SFW85390.1 hypothetical protein SAMN05661012_05728 [Chitinophaga sancti]